MKMKLIAICAAALSTSAFAGQKLSYKQVKEATRPTTCEEILDFDGTEIQYCAGLLDDIRRSNPGSITIIDSGRTIHFCAPNQPRQPNPPSPPKNPGKGK